MRDRFSRRLATTTGHHTPFVMAAICKRIPLHRALISVNYALPGFAPRPGRLRNKTTQTAKDPAERFKDLLQTSKILFPTEGSKENEALEETWTSYELMPNKRVLSRIHFQSLLNALLVNAQRSPERMPNRVQTVLSDMASCGFHPGPMEMAIKLRLAAPTLTYDEIVRELKVLKAGNILTDQHVVILITALADKGDVHHARALVHAHQVLCGLASPSPSIAIPLLLHILSNPDKFPESDDNNRSDVPTYLDNALKVWQRDLLAYGTGLSLPAYVLLIRRLLIHDQIGTANTALNDALDRGIPLGWTLMLPFIEHFVSIGEVDKAMRIFTGIRGQERNAPVPGRVWEVLIDGHLRAGNLRIAKELFSEGRTGGLSEGAIRRFRGGAGL